LNYLITGASGFVAGHLIEAIYKNDPHAEITALDLSKPDYSFIDPLLRNSIRYANIDLLSMHDLINICDASKPHFIIHLAAFSSVAFSWQKPIECFNNNFNIFLNLLETVKKVNPGIRILSIGSSEQYGIFSIDKIPLRETEPPHPVSPYAVARVAQEYMAAVYVTGFKLDIVVTRSFNHFGPRQDNRFVLSSFAKQVAEIKKGIREPVIYVGDLNIIRDFTDVRDVVKAYLHLLNKGISGEIYNVCSGIGRTLGDCLNNLIQIAGIESEIKQSAELIRPVDNPVIIGDNTKLKEITGWAPEIPFETTLRDLYEYWVIKI
jgi:GDP-4-dehydro-6-deoxy-D-mannose reductase